LKGCWTEQGDQNVRENGHGTMLAMTLTSWSSKTALVKTEEQSLVIRLPPGGTKAMSSEVIQMTPT
jgi:hypothetical protein